MEGDRDHRSPFPFLRVMGTHTTAFFRTRNSSPFFHGVDMVPCNWFLHGA